MSSHIYVLARVLPLVLPKELRVPLITLRVIWAMHNRLGENTQVTRVDIPSTVGCTAGMGGCFRDIPNTHW
jgi:hypothetical protein